MNNNYAKNYILYARKSTEDSKKQVTSIRDQINAMQKVASKNGLHIFKVISEEKSAKRPGRIGFTEMIDLLKSGKADGIITWKLDRLARNMVDAGVICDHLQNGIVEHIQTYQSSHLPTDNVLNMVLELGSSNQYVRDLSVTVKRGMRSKAESGWYPSHLPIGYIRLPKHERNQGISEVLPHAKYFELLSRIWKMLLTGKYTLAQLHRYANRQGLKHKGKYFSDNGFRCLFKNVFYSGFYYWKDEDDEYNKLKGRHKAMITPDDFQRTQEIINSNIKGRKEPQFHYLFSSLLKCSQCQYSIVPERKCNVTCTGCRTKFSARTQQQCPQCGLRISTMKNPVTFDRVYYGCSGRFKGCHSKYISEQQLDKLIDGHLRDISIRPEFYNLIKEYLNSKEFIADEVEVVGSIINLETEFKAKKERKENIIELMIDGHLKAYDAEIKLTELQNEIDAIQIDIDRHSLSQDNWNVNLDAIMKSSLNCHTKYTGNEQIEVKREVLKNITPNLHCDIQKKKIYSDSTYLTLKQGENTLSSFLDGSEPLDFFTANEPILSEKKETILSPIQLLCTLELSVKLTLYAKLIHLI